MHYAPSILLSRIATPLQTQGTAMATAFANIFMAKTEKGIIHQSKTKLLIWKWYYHKLFVCGVQPNTK